MVVGTPEDVLDLGKAAVVLGHFRLSTLTQVAPCEFIATILREPRARLLSQYLFWRTQAHDGSVRFPPRDHARRPLGEFLSEPSVAQATDNLLCRMLLEPDPRIPSSGFIPPGDLEALASDAAAKLDALGFVGVLELGDMVWQGLSRLFEVTVTPDEQNVTGRSGPAPDTAPVARPFNARTIQVLDARTRGDALIYRHALATAGRSSEDCASLPAAAFANQLVQLGDSSGHSAMWLEKLVRGSMESR
jgi:hypothetical protein